MSRLRHGRPRGLHAADPLTAPHRPALAAVQPAAAPAFTPATPPPTVRHALHARARLTGHADQPTGVIPALALPSGLSYSRGGLVPVGPLDPAWFPPMPGTLHADLAELVIFRSAVHSVFVRQDQHARGARPVGGTWQERYAETWQRRTGQTALDFGIAAPLQALHDEARAALAADVNSRINAMNGRAA